MTKCRTMLPESLSVPVSQCFIRSRWRTTAFVVLLMVTVSCIQCTTVEHDFHIVHNVDNRSPEIDPYWYMGRGVRPIGRFGKRLSVSEGLEPVVNLLELLLSIVKKKEKLGSTLIQDDTDWLQ